MQKPDGLITFGQLYGINFICLNISFLVPIYGGQFIPADRGQGHWVVHSKSESDLNIISNIRQQFLFCCQ